MQPEPVTQQSAEEIKSEVHALASHLADLVARLDRQFTGKPANELVAARVAVAIGKEVGLGLDPESERIAGFIALARKLDLARLESAILAEILSD